VRKQFSHSFGGKRSVRVNVLRITRDRHNDAVSLGENGRTGLLVRGRRIWPKRVDVQRDGYGSRESRVDVVITCDALCAAAQPKENEESRGTKKPPRAGRPP